MMIGHRSKLILGATKKRAMASIVRCTIQPQRPKQPSLKDQIVYIENLLKEARQNQQIASEYDTHANFIAFTETIEELEYALRRKKEQLQPTPIDEFCEESQDSPECRMYDC